MAGACAAPGPEVGLVQGLLGSVDCNVGSLTESAYGALARPDSPVAALLTGLLTLYIAVLGYRLMVGRAPLRIGDLTVTVLKIGIVLALATNWPTYQQLVFDTLFKGPEQLATGMLSAIQPSGSSFRGDPFVGLQLAYDEMERSAAFFSSRAIGQVSPLQGGNAFGALALNSSAFLMLMTTLGTLLAAKIVLALLLALGPLFVAFLLFDSTRGVFEGWLRASLAFAFAPLFAILALVVQLTLVEPHLIRLAQMRQLGQLELEPAIAVFVLTLISTAVCLGGAIAVSIIATALRLPARESAPSGETGRLASGGAAGTTSSVTIEARVPQLENQPRAASVAAAAAAMERRDTRMFEGPASQRLSIVPRSGERASETAATQPLGQTYRRSAQPRRAASSVRRDG